MGSGVPAIWPRLKPRRERDLASVQRRKNFSGNKKRWFFLTICVDLYGGDTFTVLGRAHAFPSRKFFTWSHHGCQNLQILSNPPPPTGACVASTFTPLSIVVDPYTHDNYERHWWYLLTIFSIPQPLHPSRSMCAGDWCRHASGAPCICHYQDMHALGAQAGSAI